MAIFPDKLKLVNQSSKLSGSKNIAKPIFLFYVIILLLFMSAGNIKAQDEELKRFRIGLKIGVPTLFGLAAEYVLPFAGNRIGLNADFGGYSETSGSQRTDLINYSVGANYYPIKKGFGKGLYLGLSYSSLNLKFKYWNILSNVDYAKTDGKATNRIDISQLQIRVGFKTGNDSYYLRPEIGYGISSPLPTRMTVNAEYSDGSIESTTDDVKIPLSSLSLILNFAFGVQF